MSKVSGTIKAEHIETLRKMAEQLSKNAENAERMCELLQPEFDKFEARAEPHNVYVVRDYVDHRNASKRQRKEAEAILAAIQPDPEPVTCSVDHTEMATLECPSCGAFKKATPSSSGTVSVEAAARVLLVSCPNPIFDILKPALMGEIRERVCQTDEYGDEVTVDRQVPWDTMKTVIRAALRALAGERG